MNIRALVMSLAGLALLVGCNGNNGAAGGHRDTGIGAESGRLIGQEAAGKTPYLGGQIGSLLGRQAERGVAASAQQPAE